MNENNELVLSVLNQIAHTLDRLDKRFAMIYPNSDAEREEVEKREQELLREAQKRSQKRIPLLADVRPRYVVDIQALIDSLPPIEQVEEAVPLPSDAMTGG